MRNILIRILQAVVILAVASSFTHAGGQFISFKKKAAAGGGGSASVWKMIVADTGNNRIVKRTGSMATYDNQAGTSGTGDNNLSSPQNVSVGGQYVYIADSNNNRIVKRNLGNLVFVAKQGSSGAGDLQTNYPLSVLAYGDNLYIADTYNDRVLVWATADLSYVGQVGSTGAGDNNFNHPDGLATDNTYLYIADTYNHRVHKRLLTDLTLSAMYTEPSVTPSGCATDGTYVWTTDINNNLVVKVTAATMAYADYCGAGTQGSGDTQFSHPDGIAYDNGSLFIADRDNSRIVQWASTCSTTTGFVSKYGTNGTGNENLSNTVYGVAIGYQQ